MSVLSLASLIVLGLAAPFDAPEVVQASDVLAAILTILLAAELLFRWYGLRGALWRSSFLNVVDAVTLGFGVAGSIVTFLVAGGAKIDGGLTRGRVLYSLLATRAVRLVDGLAPLRSLVSTAFRRGRAVANLVGLLVLGDLVVGMATTQLFGA